MNKTFDLHRLGMVLRWDLLTNKKKYTFGLFGLMLGFIGCFVCGLYSIRGWAIQIANGGAALGAPSLSDYYISEVIGFFGIFLSIVMVVMATKIFYNMQSKGGRINFLMLPATNLEKYIARLLLMTVGSFLMVIVALIGGDMVQFLASFIITPSFHMSVSWPILSTCFTGIFNQSSLEIYVGFCALLLIHSFCVLGGTFYRKQPAILTLITGTIILFILGYTTNWLHSIHLFPLSDYLMSGSETAHKTFLMIGTIFSLSLAAFNYWASYKLFTRMQVICNKWINI